MKCLCCKKTIIEPLRLGATIGATQLKGCPYCGIVFVLLPNGDDSPVSKAIGNKSLSSLVGENTKKVFGELDKLRGYRPPKRKAEAASIIRMLKTYTPSQIIEAWEVLKQDKFYQNKELFMMTVESQIGAILKNGTYRQNPRPIRKAEEYTDPDTLRHS